ncbi:hypothetical protein E2562_020083 [Oryza meyeriana var. granulata]|uniref:Uncharacterized protein n=1 Tax=Oryza meyeriana var. granulata TaxID=110450 RepID=A0A6G1EAH5_9ORYZ|nr:hypothetical protein E2562_020083 [Oryza meyeriana var. granulata]
MVTVASWEGIEENVVARLPPKGVLAPGEEPAPWSSFLQANEAAGSAAGLLLAACSTAVQVNDNPIAGAKLSVPTRRTEMDSGGNEPDRQWLVLSLGSGSYGIEARLPLWV